MSTTNPKGNTTPLTLDEFPSTSYAEWRAEAEASLKGAPFDKKLVTRTLEGLDIQPIYNASDIAALPDLQTAPGQFPYLRGTKAASAKWTLVEDDSAIVADAKDPFGLCLLGKCPGTAPDLPAAITVRAHLVLDQGGHAIQELGYAIASGIEYLRKLQAKGTAVDDAAARLTFSFGLGSDFFMTISKIRAARVLWSRVVKACGGSEEAAKIKVHARTATWNKTALDPNVNMLRATNEAVAAVVAGCDSLRVAPFDECFTTPSDFSRRIARNIQLILAEECGFDALIDPAGGSYYVEHLTNVLIEKAWAMVQEIEKQGGLCEALKSGSIQKQIAATRDAQSKNVALRRTPVVGVNNYANPLDKPIVGTAAPRLSESYEKLRAAAAAKGSPKVFLANMGPLKQHKARADFTTGFFNAGGFTVESPAKGFATANDAAAAVLASGAPVTVVCSTDDTYPEIVPGLVAAVKSAKPKTVVVLAGYPEEHVEAFKKAGVDAFIHIRANCIETLSEILKKTEA